MLSLELNLQANKPICNSVPVKQAHWLLLVPHKEGNKTTTL